MARVLMVDDDEQQLRIWKLLLERSGHQVFTAPCPQAAAETAAEVQPEVLVLDLRIPSIEDGFELMRRLRERHWLGKIVLLSGWLPDLSGRPEACLVARTFSKPVRAATLLEAIRELSAGSQQV